MMEDVGAEEVLLTLGAQLTWEQTDEHRWDSNKFDHCSDSNLLGLGAFYIIVAEPGRKQFTVHLNADEDIDWNPRLLTSLAAACAACEFHHATGEWK